MRSTLLLQHQNRQSQFLRTPRPRTKLPNFSLPVRLLQIPQILPLRGRLRPITPRLHRAGGLEAALDSKAGPAGFAKAKEPGGAPFHKSAPKATTQVQPNRIKTGKNNR